MEKIQRTAEWSLVSARAMPLSEFLADLLSMSINSMCKALMNGKTASRWIFEQHEECRFHLVGRKQKKPSFFLIEMLI